MIIDLTIKNFRSFKDEQLFSLYAESNLDHFAHSIAYPDGKIGTLKSAAILGANASGKSNLLKAFDALRYLVVNSHKLDDGKKLASYEPFLLDEHSANAAIEFSLEFWVNRQRFTYDIHYAHSKILYECLKFYPTNKPAKLFERISPTEWKTDDGIKFGAHYKGGKKRFAYYANQTFLSRAGRDPESPQIIQQVYKYFIDDWIFFQQSSNELLELKNDQLRLKALTNIIKQIDLGISDVTFRERELSKDDVKFIQDLPDEHQASVKDILSTKVIFHHKNKKHQLIEFPETLESDGTKRLLKAMPKILLALKGGHVLFFDEIEHAFHAHVVDLIIRLFQDPNLNPNNAQLIFTTHSFHTLKSEEFRKDQIWLVEKQFGESTMSSLSDFDSTLRDNSPFDKWYDEGRLGGIPSINFAEIAQCIKILLEVEPNA